MEKSSGSVVLGQGTRLDPRLAGYVGWLDAEGFGPKSIGLLAATAAHVIVWMQEIDEPLSSLGREAIERFRLHLRTCACPGPRPRRTRYTSIARRAARFAEYLRSQGLVADESAASGLSTHPLAKGFAAWMREHRGASVTTVRIYDRIVGEALVEIGDDPHAYNPGLLRKFVLTRSATCGRSKAKLVVTAIRAFLRFLSATGACRPGLDGALPTIVRWRLAALPRYLSNAEIERILATCDASTVAGARNLAILLLLSRLGLRAGEVASLRSDDLDWSQGTIVVSGKSRRAARLPLPQDVGDAILTYVAMRSRALAPEVFLRIPPPRRALSAGGVSTIVQRALLAAGVASPARGAHVLRHSAASELLTRGASLDEVRVVLRHRDPETTRLYAKVDLALLQIVAQPWPEVTPC